MQRAEKAKELFLKGYNCSQAVLGVFDDVLPLAYDTVMKLGASFGGGMARLREVCGTCTAMFMIAGLLKGYTEPDREQKSAHYALIQSMAKRFKEENGSIICRELLVLRGSSVPGVDQGTGSQANPRTPEYYHSRPCLSLIANAVTLTCQILGIDETVKD